MRRYPEDDGTLDPELDTVPRVDKTESDGRPAGSHWYGESLPDSVERLKCLCGGIVFQVLWTGAYETSARCEGCGRWFVVHTG